MICGRMVLTRLDGMANPTPLAGVLNSGSMAVSVGMPTTLPCKSTSAPPLLPGLIDASLFLLLASHGHVLVACKRAYSTVFPIYSLNTVTNSQSHGRTFPIQAGRAPEEAEFDT